MDTWYLAICRDCAPILPQPFRDRTERDRWVIAHKKGTAHEVTCGIEEDGSVRLY